MMWHTKNVYASHLKKTIQPEQQFLKNLPDRPAFDKVANSGLSKILWYLLILYFT
jgi:stearoyl-CoA desaturase (delta-9 desaturase)